MNTDDTNTTEAVGSPLGRGVRPVATVERDGATVRLNWASVAAAHNALPGPLYDQATLDAAVATGREQWAELDDLEAELHQRAMLVRDDDESDPLPALDLLRAVLDERDRLRAAMEQARTALQKTMGA